MRYLILVIICIVGLSTFACRDKIVCPAFQSTYILNDSLRTAKYSLFGADSMPKFQMASRRDKYGISKKYRFFNYFKKNYDLKTAPKENWLGPPAKDSLFIYPEDTLLNLDEGEFYASDFYDLDSLSSDSTSVVPSVVATAEPENKGPKYKYRYDRRNPYSSEQIYYNKHFGEMLVDTRPPPPPPAEESEVALDESDTTQVSGKKKLVPGFFKKKKKNKDEEDQQQESDEEDLEEDE